MSELHKKIFDMLMESQYWAPEQMLVYQRHQLSQLLRHARTNVPFYKARLDPVFRSNGDIDWDRWTEIPIVKRHNLVIDRESMLASRLPPGHGDTREIFSAGSSGTPIITTHNHLAGLVSAIAVHRSHTWHKLDWSKTLVTWMGDDDLAVWPEGEEMESWSPSWLSRELRGKSFRISRFTHEEKVLDFIKRKQPFYLAGRPKSLQTLALAAEKLAIKIRLDAVLVFGTGVTEDEREDFDRIFGAQVISNYSSGEGYKIGICCETGPHYHVNPELTFLEILDDNDNPCSIGQPGRVIITTLYNTAQPLIRYEQGDIAIRGPNCSCGKTLPVLQEISGRISHLFHLPDGRKVAPSLADQEFSKVLGSRTWQLVQTGLHDVELRYVQTDPSVIANKPLAEKMIHHRTHPALRIKFVQLAETPLTPAGKFIQYKSELPSTK